MTLTRPNASGQELQPMIPTQSISRDLTGRPVAFGLVV